MRQERWQANSAEARLKRALMVSAGAEVPHWFAGCGMLVAGGL
jgi:hypothetical protein